MLTCVSGDDEWPLLGHYRHNTITTADLHWVTQQESRYESSEGMRGRSTYVHVCTYAGSV